MGCKGGVYCDCIDTGVCHYPDDDSSKEIEKIKSELQKLKNEISQKNVDEFVRRYDMGCTDEFSNPDKSEAWRKDLDYIRLLEKELQAWKDAFNEFLSKTGLSEEEKAVWLPK